jgi:CHAT domain-containing protein
MKFVPKNGTGMSKEEEDKEDEITIKQLDQSMNRFAEVLQEIEADFKQPASPLDESPGIKVLQELQATLDQLTKQTQQKTVAIYQLVGENNFYTVLVTPDGISSVSTKVRGDRVNQQAIWLWSLLQSDDYDPALLSNVVYDTVFKPIESQLPKDTRTILWSLDGNLRYVPMAALYDGKQYLVERYNHVLFTRLDKEKIARPTSPTWTAYAFATTKPHRVEFLDNVIEFEPLGSAQDEMNVFRTGTASRGLITGDVFSDKDFTKDSFIAKLKQGRPLIHISSHFLFRPGDEYRSFLLLGDGSVMTLSEMKSQAGLFKGVELLTLSACDTAAQLPDADGREIDGFAELAQRLGASSVMASLWHVRDVSTALLMDSFYRNRQVSKMNKAEALRQSQLDMIHKSFAPTTLLNRARLSTSRGAPSTKNIVVEKKYLVPYEADKSERPFAHPYYWSPFVLFGNWR